MKISFNPSNSNKNILDLIKNNKDIIFDLKGHSIFARGVEFKGTDTNTWRDVKINNVSIGSHTLDLRNGSNTTLTNTNGVVTINSTWRPVVDNLTSDSTTSSLSAKQGKVLKALIDGKSTATKLQTARSIWGQSFDGTGNVSGSLSEVGNIHFKVDNSYDIGSNAAASRYIYTHWLGARSGRKLELGANNSGFGQGLCIDTNLNVGIGTNSPAYKLHVVGDIYTTTGFKKNGSSDSYVLLGGGGHKAISDFAISTHTHTVFKNNLMIKGTNGISDSASIHLGIGDSDTGFKWISDGVCQIYANNVAVGQWTSGGMNWFTNPTVNGNKVWNAGNDGSGSGLDADTLDGYHAKGSNDRPYGHIPTIGSDGVMEVGRYIDFHNDNNGKHDFSTRLQSTGNYGNEVNLPSARGTLALINDVNNYYWANVKISTSSSTTTSPTFSNVYLGNSLYLNTRGSNSIYNGPNDSANGVGGPLNNLVFSSWQGVSFTTSCAGLTYTNKNAVSINCRTGQLYAREVQANGFMHTGHNNNDAVLLAGGGYKTLKDFIFLNKSYNYTDHEHYSLTFHKLSGICNNLVWVDGHVKGSVATFFVIDPAVFPYRYDEDPNLNTTYVTQNNYITINAMGRVTINNAADHYQRIGFFYTGRA